MGLLDFRTCILSYCFLRQLCQGQGTSEIFMVMREMTVFVSPSLPIAKILLFFKAHFNSSRNFPSLVHK